MAKHSRLHVLNTIKQLGLVPLFYHPNPETAIKVVDALVAGGALFVEFTNRGDRAIEVFKKVAQYRDTKRPELILGVGSICNAGAAAMYMAAGADAIVAPLLDEGTARTCNSQKVPYMPGCGSVSEIHQAHLLGVEICKVFPAGQVGGPAFIKNVKAPCAWAELMPTGGVSPTRENLTEWFEAGATCVGMGSKLVSKDLIQTEDYGALTQKVKDTLALINDIR
ncbi:MAG: bifunctional 4-hydroxy-2-oxoglutarate aldolase/2-dehydro-3-deoxy-phosphogluconate aldolase [Phycisphaeraceae bacterium]|nr:bifunctional 4-hydroxy-2-oxoglutarate aldolase/2-dehydro-3-deoxy-phosphogluconate aldolase [Phycisphaeraceae bacterium]